MSRKEPRVLTYYEAAQWLGVSRDQLMACLRKQDALMPEETIPRRAFIDAGYLVIHHGEKRITETVVRHYRTGRVTIQGLAWLDQLLNPKAIAA